MSLTRLMSGPRRRRESEARRGAHFICPDCGSAMVIRSSQVASSTMRSLQYCCTNHDCCASFGATLELSMRLSLPAQPNPGVQLPLSNRIDRGQLRATLDNAGDARPVASSLKPITADMFEGADLLPQAP